MHFILTHNYHKLNDESHIQTHGTAMRTKMDPTYANIFMTEKYLLDYCTDNPSLCLRYMDDISVIFLHGEDKLEKFNAYVSSIHPKINLTLTSSATKISHLDGSVLFEGTNIPTSIYTKSTYKLGCLSYKSFHPMHVIKRFAQTNYLLNNKRLIYSSIIKTKNNPSA